MTNNTRDINDVEKKREQMIKEHGITEKFKLLFINVDTKEMVRECKREMTTEEVEVYLKSFKENELRNLTVIGFSNFRTATMDMEHLNQRTFHKGISTKSGIVKTK